MAKDKKTHWDFLTQALESENARTEYEAPAEEIDAQSVCEVVAEVLETEDVSKDTPENDVVDAPEEKQVAEQEDDFLGWTQVKKPYRSLRLSRGEAAQTKEVEEEPQPEVVEASVESEPEAAEDSVVEPVESTHVEGDGYCFRKIKVVRPPKVGFGFGILDKSELPPEEEVVEATTKSEPVMEVKADSERVEGDVWSRKVMELDREVGKEPRRPMRKFAEKKEVPAPKKESSAPEERERKETPRREERSREERSEKPSRDRGRDRDRRDRGRGENRERRENVERVERVEEPRRPRRGYREEVAPSVPVDEEPRTPRRRGRNSRSESVEEESYAPVVPGYESQEARRHVRDLFPEEQVVEEVVTEETVEEPVEEGRPNGARSRRRRRGRQDRDQDREMMEKPSIHDVYAVEEVEEEEEKEEAPVSRKRSRRGDRNRSFRREEPAQVRRQDDFEDEEDETDTLWEEVGEDDENETPVVEKRSRRRDNRNRPSRKETSRYSEPEDDFEDDEPNDFEEVEVDEEDDGEIADFSQENIIGWQDAIGVIVNTNLSARNREPSSMAGNVKRKRPSSRK